MRKSRQAVKATLATKVDNPVFQYGYLGDASGTVKVPGRPNYVYVTVDDDHLIEVYNVRVPPTLRLPVAVGYDPAAKGLLQVLGVRTVERSAANERNQSVVPAHHQHHEWLSPDGGDDPIFVQLRQMMPLRPTPAGGFLLAVDRDVQLIGSQWTVVGGQVLDLWSHSPFSQSGKARYALVSLNTSTGALAVTDGTVVDRSALTLAHIPATPAGNKPICAVRLYYGQEKIIEARTETDLIDMRWAAVGTIGQPQTHHTTHENGGADEINVGGLSGVLADPQTAAAHKATHENGGTDEINVGGLSGLLADPQNAGSLRAVTVANAVPTSGQALVFNGTEWAPGSAGGGGGGAPYQWFVDGALAAATQVGMTAVVPAACTITKVILYVRTLGSAGTTTIDIHKNGTTIFTTQANRPALAYNAAAHTAEGTPDVTTLAAGDVLTLDIDEAATGAADMTVALVLEVPSSGGGGGGGGWMYPCDGRLTLASGTPVPSADQTAKTVLYFTPYKGNQVATYTGSAWEIHNFAELSLSLSGLAADKNHDIFIVYSSGFAIEAVAWTDDTTRATALTLQDGVYVKSGATTRRYLGTIRTTGTAGQCEDSKVKRFVWNAYNRCSRAMYFTKDPAQLSYNGGLRSFQNDTDYRIHIVSGLGEDSISVQGMATIRTKGVGGVIGIGANSTTINAALSGLSYSANDMYLIGSCFYAEAARIGYSYYQLLERSVNNGFEETPDFVNDHTGLTGVWVA